MNPLDGNALASRDDVSRACGDLLAPLTAHYSKSGARLRLGTRATTFPQRVAELEGFARPLWGLTAMHAGGDDVGVHWERYRRGLEAGTDPDHPEYWGPIERDGDQRQVEMSPICFAIVFATDALWDPLSPRVRRRVIEWLRGSEQHEPAPNNWHFFRLMTALALERVGEELDAEKVRESLDLIDRCYESGGWYRDGEHGAVDHYIAHGFHTDGLIYAASGLGDRARAATYLERARLFAGQFAEWFDPSGGVLPYGRSLTYRFAASAFWSALALAGVEALPWPEVKGLLLRHLRWWSRHPIAERDGVLSLGYAYDTHRTVEDYSSRGSVYWAMKGLLALAAPADHPFWTCGESEAPDPDAAAVVVEQTAPGLLISRTRTQVLALCGKSMPTQPPVVAPKYAKFAYSSLFGYCVESTSTFGRAGSDSMLAVIDAATGERRVRTAVVEGYLRDGCTYTRWEPWPDVVIETVLAGAAPWHVRAHRITTGRELRTEEGGFAVGFEPERAVPSSGELRRDEQTILVETPVGVAGLVDLGKVARTPQIRVLAPGVNLMAPNVAVPTLSIDLVAGTHTLACAVFGSDTSDGWADVPAVPDRAWRLLPDGDRR